MKPHLEKLAKIAQDETYITYDELEGWPREQLEEEGYLKEAGLQSAITCDQCSERCPIPRDRVIRRKDDESIGLLPCEYNPDISFVDVNLDRYKQYRIIKRKLLELGYLATPVDSEPDELITLTEAGVLLGVHKGTVSNWADDGKIKDNGKKGRGRKVSKASVLMTKHEREEKQAQGDYEEYRRDIENIPGMH